MVDRLDTPNLEPNLRLSWLETRSGSRVLARLQRTGSNSAARIRYSEFFKMWLGQHGQFQTRRTGSDKGLVDFSGQGKT